METLNWVRRLNYLGHSVGGSDKLINLNPDELLDIAQSATGLSDFGDDNLEPDYYENVKNLDDAGLHTFGRLQVREKLLRCLRNRLFISNKIKLQPAILNEVVDKPLIITGMSHTGTTILFELLSQDLFFRSALGFEAICPAEPIPGSLAGGVDREKMAQSSLGFIADIQLEFKAIHTQQYDLSAECWIIIDRVLDYIFSPAREIDEYQTWDKQVDNYSRYFWHKKVLQLLQYGSPIKPSLLKCPSHIHFMKQILEYYPNSRIIHTHRDPVKAIPSLYSLEKSAYSLSMETCDKKKIRSAVLTMSEGGLHKIIKQRQAGIIPENQITDIHFKDLLSDPVATIRTAYKNLGIEFSEEFKERILNYLDKRPRNKYGKHNYQPEDQGLSNEKIREQFRFYTDHYNIALEA